MTDTTNRGYRRTSVTSIVTTCTVFSIGTGVSLERGEGADKLADAGPCQRRSDQPTHNTRGRQSASFPGCAEARPRQRAAAVTSARKPKRRIRRTRNCTGCEQIAASFAGGRRTWWAHFEFVRINTTPTILRNQFEDATAPSGHVAGGLAAACVSRNRKSPFRS